MAEGVVSRKLEVFSVHCTIGNNAGPYERVLDYVAALAVTERVIKYAYKAVALPTFSRVGTRFKIEAFEGDPNFNPIIFNLQTGKQRRAPLGRGDVIAQKTHAIIDFRKRRAAVEYVRGGAKADEIADVIESLASGSPEFEGITFGLAPMPAPGFLDELDKFDRIRVARLTMAKPNAGWTDRFNRLSAIIGESNGRYADVAVRAARGESLEKKQGIMEVIREVAEDPQPYLTGAEIRGIRKGEEAEVSVKLAEHAQQRRVVLPVKDGAVDDESAFDELEKTLKAVPEPKD